MKSTWILIANSCQARLFKTGRSYHDMKLIEEFYHPESREKIIDLVADGAGRYRQLSGPKSAYEEPHSPKEVEAMRFAHQLASKLEKGRTSNLYNGLILIAPAHFQGLLNKYCNSQIKNKIVNVIDKDYTKIREHDLNKYLNGKLTWPRAA